MNDLQEIIDLLRLKQNDLDLESIYDLDNYDTSFKNLNKIVVEIARYAMMDISTERDHKGEEYQPPGSKTFHTTTLNRWVEQKCRAVLLPYGVPELVIKRAVKSIMSRNYDTSDSLEKEWDKSDRFQPDILELGECLRVGEGRNIIAPTRYVVSDKNNSRLIISPYPTDLLRKNLTNLTIQFNGILRMANLNPNCEWPKLQEQRIDEYASIPKTNVPYFSVYNYRFVVNILAAIIY